ncbi:HNH endonuclease, partial [Candidatus Omnitrophota bacterium]
MNIILSQHIDTDSDYDDIPFQLYHYPKKYRKQIKPGDIFIYYQGDRWKRENRYYFGCGVVGEIESRDDGQTYFAKILEGQPFPNKVPIYMPDGKNFYESIGHEHVRNKSNPSWQNSIRKISLQAYNTILQTALIRTDIFSDSSSIEVQLDAISILKKLNQKYRKLNPLQKHKKIEAHLDRGVAVTKALKRILKPICQVCNNECFEKRNGDKYIEAHHIKEISTTSIGSLCTDNIILVCPNCHREIHYGKYFKVSDDGDFITLIT